jgi:hypothetical protein
VLLPRVVEVALTSAERAAKVAACELLHATTMLLLAAAPTSRAAAAGGDPPTANVGLYAHVLPALLRLAVDADPVPRQLFAPLVLQLARLAAAGHPYGPTTIDVCLNSTCDTYACMRAQVLVPLYVWLR